MYSDVEQSRSGPSAGPATAESCARRAVYARSVAYLVRQPSALETSSSNGFGRGVPQFRLWMVRKSPSFDTARELQKIPRDFLMAGFPAGDRIPFTEPRANDEQPSFSRSSRGSMNIRSHVFRLHADESRIWVSKRGVLVRSFDATIHFTRQRAMAPCGVRPADGSSEAEEPPSRADIDRDVRHPVLVTAPADAVVRMPGKPKSLLRRGGTVIRLHWLTMNRSLRTEFMESFARVGPVTAVRTGRACRDGLRIGR